ncbi:MAG: protein kinase [Kofleriaceae bacterium]|nr:protein kinase [Kofleriaceae bacterium]
MTPRQVLHYRILGELGQGGMGQVFRARDERLGREVALKMLPADMAADADFQARLLREARAASALNHPGIVTLHDLETADGVTFLVMELVEGERVSDLAVNGVPWEKAVDLVADVADALAAAHARGILHRDIKSDNVMVTPSGQPKVLDFGLAKLRVDLAAEIAPGSDPEAGPTANMRRKLMASTLPPGTVVPNNPNRMVALAATLRPQATPGGTAITRAGQILGTPSYMAPECYEGTADARTEVFALGVVLYELLASKRPFDRESELATMSAILLDDPAPPSKAAPDRGIPEKVDAIVAKALAKSPHDRYADMTAFASALRESLRAPAPPPAPPKLPRVWPWLAAGGGALALAGGFVWLVLRDSSDGRAAKLAPPTIEVTASRRLTLEEGCEEYPHFHPDGKRIVFDGIASGDYEIMTLDLDTNARKQLTSTPGWDYASALSPDGTQVAYVHEDALARTLRVLPLDGSTPPKDLGATVGYPAWTHDGALLLGDAAGRILRRDVASGRDTELGKLPAGARLYHLVEVEGAGVAVLWWTSSDADQTALGELDLDGKLRIVEETATDYEGGLASAHHRRGYYATRKGATEGNQLLFRPWGDTKAIPVPGGVSPGAGIDVSRDGTRLVFSTCLEREYIARISLGQPPVVVSRGAWQDTNPYIVDSHRLLVTSNRLGQQNGWLIDLDGKQAPRAVTPPGALGATPSPDGNRIVYASRTGLAVVDLDPSGTVGAARVLTTDPSDAAPAFARDNEHVVFERTVRGVTSVYSISVSGGVARELVVGAQPAPSPVDDTIVFVTAADASGARRVMKTTLAGTPAVPITGVELATWQRPRISPDGKELMLVRGYQQVIAVALDGNTPARVLWNAGTGSVGAAAWTLDGGVIATVGGYEGDLWLADGTFP